MKFLTGYNKEMNIRKILSELNVVSDCKKYGLSVWQCPQFLFLIMGIVIIITSIVTYTLGTRVADPETVLMIVLTLTVVLFVITFSITRSLEGLAEASRLKSEFVSVVSHQLRSPLSNLKWALDFLESGRIGKIEGKQAEYFKILKDNTVRMTELASSLLTVSRIEQGRLPLNKREFSLEDLAREIISAYAPQSIARKIKVSFEAKSNIPRVLADLSQVKLVVENLIGNAIRYTREGGNIKVRISNKGKALLFEVEDNGVGIPKADQQYIFQKFFRSRNVLKHQTQGTGLGLYIAKSIIKRSGGKIGFKSQENKGSTFWFIVPIKN